MIDIWITFKNIYLEYYDWENTKRHSKISFPRENEAIKNDLVEFKVQCLKVFCYHGNKSTILLFNSIFRKTLKFLVNFTLLKYVTSQRSYGLLITEEPIFWLSNFGNYFRFSASLKPLSTDALAFVLPIITLIAFWLRFSSDFSVIFNSSVQWKRIGFHQCIKSYLWF